jgi:hypothetical protein
MYSHAIASVIRWEPPQEEEDDFAFTLLLPIISWPLIFISSFRMSWFMYGLIPFTQMIVPTLLGLYAIRLIHKKKK